MTLEFSVALALEIVPFLMDESVQYLIKSNLGNWVEAINGNIYDVLNMLCTFPVSRQYMI